MEKVSIEHVTFIPARTIPQGTKAILVSDELMDQIATQAPGNLTWEWGEPDEYGFYTPTWTRHSEEDV